MDNDNKDYILNIRLSKKTYDQVKNLAKENAESISHLVRKVINDGLDIAADISDDIFGEKSKTPNSKKTTAKKSTNIINYYNGIAARDMLCANCSHKIKSGQKIIVGESTFGKKYYFCVNCK